MGACVVRRQSVVWLLAALVALAVACSSDTPLAETPAAAEDTAQQTAPRTAAPPEEEAEATEESVASPPSADEQSAQAGEESVAQQTETPAPEAETAPATQTNAEQDDDARDEPAQDDTAQDADEPAESPAAEDEPAAAETDANDAEQDDDDAAPPVAQPDPEAGSLRILAASATGPPIIGAHVVAADGGGATRSDEEGFVPLDTVPGERYHVVAAGYWPLRNIQPTDGVIALRPIDVRAIYLPYEQLWRPESIEWALGLAREGLINAIVIDIKEEGGAVLPLFATEAVLEIEAVVDPGADMDAFLTELERLGVYRIARQAVFLDTRLGRADLDTAILTRGGTQLIADLGLGWTTPFSAKARAYNIEIALAATSHFEEIQFDYIRFPGGPLQIHEQTTGEERSAAIVQFVREAGVVLRAAGAAMSIDTFGETAVIRVEDSIGQVLEDLIPHIDYYSPMLYPSTWAFGSFDLEYPPAHPELVVRLSMRTAVQRIEESGITGVLVRPWLQDYRDYQPRMLRYGFDEVIVQIRASAAEGGVGFMLWNPTLLYHTDVLGVVRDDAARAGAG